MLLMPYEEEDLGS